MEDHYKPLGVRRNADQQEIKDQYRLLSKKYHPDKPDGNAEKFKKLASAYEVLSDPERRRFYDLTGSDVSEKDYDRKAGGLLQQMFQLVLSQNGLIKIQKMDILLEMKNNLFIGMGELDKNIKVARDSRKEIGNVLRRLKHKSKMNPIGLMLIVEIKKHTETIEKSKHDKEVGKRASHMLKEYGYDFDKEMKMNHRVMYGMKAMSQTVTFTGAS
jgi:DnaJ-class molecular chaperone